MKNDYEESHRSERKDKLRDMNPDSLFERLYTVHFPRVKNFVLSLSKSEEDAEDIAQNVFLKLWTKPELWTDEKDIAPYLYTATRNELLNLFKHQKVTQDYEERIINAQLVGELCDEDNSLIESIYHREALLLIEMKLNRLPERQRRIFEMSRFDCISNKEIAERMQISLRTVEDNIYRTLKELKKVLMYVIIFHFVP